MREPTECSAAIITRVTFLTEAARTILKALIQAPWVTRRGQIECHEDKAEQFSDEFKANEFRTYLTAARNVIWRRDLGSIASIGACG